MLTPEYEAKVDEVLTKVRDEILRAAAKWPPANSAHESFAILHEEVDELWEHVKVNQKHRDLPAMQMEAVQVAAMGVRFAVEVCDEVNGRK